MLFCLFCSPSKSPSFFFFLASRHPLSFDKTCLSRHRTRPPPPVDEIRIDAVCSHELFLSLIPFVHTHSSSLDLDLDLDILNTQTPDVSPPPPSPPPLAPSTRLTRLSPRSNTHHIQEARGFYPPLSPKPKTNSPYKQKKKSRHPHPRPAKSSTLSFSQHIYPPHRITSRLCHILGGFSDSCRHGNTKQGGNVPRKAQTRQNLDQRKRREKKRQKGSSPWSWMNRKETRARWHQGAVNAGLLCCK
ncbi:hypothetical protein J3F84DRAFT_112645 [Trichoderma pleuroticola]